MHTLPRSALAHSQTNLTAVGTSPAALRLPILDEPRRAYSLEESDSYCRVTYSHRLGRTGNLPWFLLLPRLTERPHLLAVAVFARCAESFVTDPCYSGKRPLALDAWESELMRAFHGEADHPVFVALRDAIDLCKLPLTPCLDFLNSCRRDLHRAPFFSFQSLRDYCRQRSESLGHLALHLLGHRDPALLRYAGDFHAGLQLVNFLQDLSLDLPHNRCYLPIEDLYHFGISDSDLAALCGGTPLDETATRAWRDLLAFQAMRARSILLRGRPLLEIPGADLRGYVQSAYRSAMALLAEIELLGPVSLRVRPRLTDPHAC
jgi:phytoene/squalene synthetase